ncbi:MAG: Terminase-like family protein [Verrucomicrobia bacterium]|nr:Terminase-like family protein [Verrucomicrobiota bacterium]
MSFWIAQAGPQSYAATCPAKFIFFGGARGGGKTDTILGRQLYGAEKYGAWWNGLICRRKYKDLAKVRARLDELIKYGLPAVRVGGDNQPNDVRFANGAHIWLLAFQNLSQADDEQSKEYTEIGIDEGPTIPYIAGLIEKLKGTMRSPHGVPTAMIIAGNPGGPGHAYIKSLFIDGHDPLMPWTDDAGQSHVFIPSRVYDNTLLMENDPDYEVMLRSIRDPALRRAWLDGDWDVFPGQAFGIRREWHVLDDAPAVPATAPLYSTFDWGWGKPFSWGWWWEDNDGRLYRFAEWYGMGGAPNEGLRMLDRDIAGGIKEREIELGIWGRAIRRLSGHDCFAERPDYKTGDPTPATAETFAQYGIFLARAPVSRRMRIQQFRERIAVDVDVNGDMVRRPMLVVYPNCHEFLRTIPALTMSEVDPEDVDTEQEDHIYDEASLVCTAKPMRVMIPGDGASGTPHRPPSPESALAAAGVEAGKLFGG